MLSLFKLQQALLNIHNLFTPSFHSLFYTVQCTVQYSVHNKVRTYKEYDSVCPSSELGLSQPLSRQRVFPSPQKQGGGGTLACGWGVGGSPNSDEWHTLWYSLYVRTLWCTSSLLAPTPLCSISILYLPLDFRIPQFSSDEINNDVTFPCN
jgi:hypothetical protein